MKTYRHIASIPEGVLIEVTRKIKILYWEIELSRGLYFFKDQNSKGIKLKWPKTA